MGLFKDASFTPYQQYRSMVEADRARYSGKPHLSLYFTNAGYRITVNLRRCELLRSYAVLAPISILQRIRYRRLCLKYGCDIPSHVSIGPGLKIDHPVGIVVNTQAKIGSNCTLKSGVVIGKTEKGIPIIGDDVLIGVHALLIGGIRVGNEAKIGAGAIVVKDVPDKATVVCTAAHVVGIEDGIR